MKDHSEARQKRLRISERTLVDRIKRRLARDGEVLRKARSAADREELGGYYVMQKDVFQRPKTHLSDGVVYVHIDLEKLARQLGVIEEWEQLDRA